VSADAVAVVDTDSNGSGGGGDSPAAAAAAARKKRRSWKQHRVEALDVSYVTGLRRTHDLYACDQCDKMFGKQSSLARHKYEHSGTPSVVYTCCWSSVCQLATISN